MREPPPPPRICIPLNEFCRNQISVEVFPSHTQRCWAQLAFIPPTPFAIHPSIQASRHFLSHSHSTLCRNGTKPADIHTRQPESLTGSSHGMGKFHYLTGFIAPTLPPSRSSQCTAPPFVWLPLGRAALSALLTYWGMCLATSPRNERRWNAK